MSYALPRPPVPSVSHSFYAETVYDRIQKLLNEKNRQLREGQSLSVEVPLSNGLTIQASSFGYQNPNFIIVYSTDTDGQDIEAYIQHTKIDLVVTAINKPNERRRIGFKGEAQKQTSD